MSVFHDKQITGCKKLGKSCIFAVAFMIKDLLYIGAGGFLGSVLRYLVAVAMRSHNVFPWGTFTVNLVGCLIIGLICGFACRHPNFPPSVNWFLTVGLCGGFTTFSTFSKEALTLLQNGNITAFCLYAIGSVVLGVSCVALGYWLAK